MDKTLQQCRREDYEALLQFLNKVFTKEEENWFVKHMGNIYESIEDMSDERIGYNYILKDEERIIASIGIFPMPMKSKIGQQEICFNMGGIGSVAVDKDYRGHGIMSAMLEQVNVIMRELDYPLSWLQGNRFRYKNYGWDTAGTQYYIQLAQSELNKMGLQPIKGRKATYDDMSQLEVSYSYYENCQERSTELWASHLRRPGLHVIVGGDSYLIHEKDNPSRIYEMAGAEDVFPLLMGHMLKHQLDSVEVTCPRDKSSLTRKLMAGGASYRITATGCSYGRIQIVNEEKMWSLIEVGFEDEMDRYCLETYKASILQQPKLTIIKTVLDFVECHIDEYVPRLPLWVSEIDLV